jgi:hypothetical protein
VACWGPARCGPRRSSAARCECRPPRESGGSLNLREPSNRAYLIKAIFSIFNEGFREQAQSDNLGSHMRDGAEVNRMIVPKLSFGASSRIPYRHAQHPTSPLQAKPPVAAEAIVRRMTWRRWPARPIPPAAQTRPQPLEKLAIRQAEYRCLRFGDQMMAQTAALDGALVTWRFPPLDVRYSAGNRL